MHVHRGSPDQSASRSSHHPSNPDPTGTAQPDYHQNLLRQITAYPDAENTIQAIKKGARLDPHNQDVILAVNEALQKNDQRQIRLLFLAGAAVPSDHLDNHQLCVLLVRLNILDQVCRMVKNGMKVDIENPCWYRYLTQQGTSINESLDRMTQAGLTMQQKQVTRWVSWLLDTRSFNVADGLILEPILHSVEPSLHTIVAHNNRTAFFTFLVQHDSLESAKRLMSSGLQVDMDNPYLLEILRFKYVTSKQSVMHDFLKEHRLLDRLVCHIIDDRSPQKIIGLDFHILVNLFTLGVEIPAGLKNKNLFLATLLDHGLSFIKKSSKDNLYIVAKLIQSGTFPIDGDSAETFKIALANSISNNHDMVTKFLRDRGVTITLADLEKSPELAKSLVGAVENNPTVALDVLAGQTINPDCHGPIAEKLLRISLENGYFQLADRTVTIFKLPQVMIHKTLIDVIDNKLYDRVGNSGQTLLELSQAAGIEALNLMLRVYLIEIMQLLDNHVVRRNLSDLDTAKMLGNKLITFGILLAVTAQQTEHLVFNAMCDEFVENSQEFWRTINLDNDPLSKAGRLKDISWDCKDICLYLDEILPV